MEAFLAALLGSAISTLLVWMIYIGKITRTEKAESTKDQIYHRVVQLFTSNGKSPLNSKSHNIAPYLITEVVDKLNVPVTTIYLIDFYKNLNGSIERKCGKYKYTHVFVEVVETPIAYCINIYLYDKP